MIEIREKYTNHPYGQYWEVTKDKKIRGYLGLDGTKFTPHNIIELMAIFDIKEYRLIRIGD